MPSSGPPEVHFGLKGANQIDQLDIIWPDGERSRLYDVAPGRISITRSALDPPFRCSPSPNFIDPDVVGSRMTFHRKTRCHKAVKIPYEDLRPVGAEEGDSVWIRGNVPGAWKDKFVSMKKSMANSP